MTGRSPMNDTEIENWRIVLFGAIGHDALLMPREQIIALRDRMQASVTATEQCVQEGWGENVDEKKYAGMLRLTYVDANAIKKAKKEDWLANIEALHQLLDHCDIPRGDEHGAYTLYFRICGLRAERNNAVSEKLLNAESRAALAEGAMKAQDENHRAQLEALGLSERFPSLTHLADDIGEALLKAERERDAMRGVVDAARADPDKTQRVTDALAQLDAVLVNDAERNL